MRLFTADKDKNIYTCAICNTCFTWDYEVYEDIIGDIMTDRTIVSTPFYGMKKHLKHAHAIKFVCVHGPSCDCDKQYDDIGMTKENY